jgi:hypothetical protein
MNKVIVTLANDIFIEAKQIRRLAEEIKDDVGCAIPYLSVSDYGTQRMRRIAIPRRSFPNMMPFNVAAFSREALEKLGFIPEQMTGCCNDLVFL